MQNPSQSVVIIGAGPAGLTAALELLQHSNLKPIIIESDTQVGGISKTINYKGNRMDLGGHRFFSKSDWVMNFWQNLMPLASENTNVQITYQNKTRSVGKLNTQDSYQEPVNPDTATAKLLVRPRLSRIYFLRRFFDYPIKLNLKTALNLGPIRLTHIVFSYLATRIKPRPEHSLEDFIINRFGKALYLTFFKDYTEKVWGVPCAEISAEWGAQRIKGLSIWAALKHAAATLLKIGSDKTKHTSLIEQFLYPALGPGQIWEVAADKITALGGEIHLNCKVTKIHWQDDSITAIEFQDKQGAITKLATEQLISTMPVRELIAALQTPPPGEVAKVAAELCYRDFITVGVLVKKLKPSAATSKISERNLLPDNWIYIQEKEVKLGRLQIFNNWSPHLVAAPDTIWLGLEYFANEGDPLWQMSKQEFAGFAINELASIDLIEKEDVLDQHVVYVQKAYPAYFGSYAQFDIVKNWLNKLQNLYLVGRNGMHRYNNQDHSMLTAKLAAESIIKNDLRLKDQIWQVNIDDEYHEEKS